jgi:hypothetical protein
VRGGRGQRGGGDVCVCVDALTGVRASGGREEAQARGRAGVGVGGRGGGADSGFPAPRPLPPFRPRCPFSPPRNSPPPPRPPRHSRSAYLGTDWGRRTVAFTGHGCALNADIAVRDMMASVQAEFPARRDELVALLGIDLDWRMHQLSDGQRRRVQIMLQLLRPVSILLLDEITTDLDLITRQDFLGHLRALSARDGTTIVYATHIFDGLDDWPTHLVFVDGGAVAKFGPVAAFPDLVDRRAAGTVAPLLRTIESWLRASRDAKRAAGMKITERAEHDGLDELRGAAGNGYLPGRFSQGYA